MFAPSFGSLWPFLMQVRRRKDGICLVVRACLTHVLWQKVMLVACSLASLLCGEERMRAGIGTRHNLHRNAPLTYLASQRWLPKVSKTSSKLIPRTLGGTFNMSIVALPDPWHLQAEEWARSVNERHRRWNFTVAIFQRAGLDAPFLSFVLIRVFLDAF